MSIEVHLSDGNKEEEAKKCEYPIVLSDSNGNASMFFLTVREIIKLAKDLTLLLETEFKEEYEKSIKENGRTKQLRKFDFC